MLTVNTSNHEDANNHGIGKLVLVTRKVRIGRNPATGEAIKIPAKTALKTRVEKAIKLRINPT